MKNKLPLIIVGVVVVVVLAIGGWWFMGKGGQISLPTTEVGEQASGEQTPSEEGSFVGRLKDALTVGQSMKCTWKQDEDNFATAYIKDDQIRTEVTQEGEKAYIIVKDNCTYSWQEGESDGFKVCFEPEEMEVEEGEEEEVTMPEEGTVEMPDYEYSCEPAVVSESMFSLPVGINFLSMEDLMGGMGE